MREIVLDTETTGFEPEDGHRIIEIGCVELFHHVPTGNYYHQYINPDRDIPEEAFSVHGISEEFLQDKPRFASICSEFLEFISNSALVIHNAKFDMKFINAELKWCDRNLINKNEIIDTLKIARNKYPAGPNSLDALCKRLGVDNSNRTKHGALLDSELLAEVYLELIGGRQPDLMLGQKKQEKSVSNNMLRNITVNKRSAPLIYEFSLEEKRIHDELIDSLGDDAIWKQYI